MALIVQKFGGTSVGTIERIARVANLVEAEVERGHRVVVVVSAMAGVTNQLVSWVNQSAGCEPDPAEHDAVVSTGEQVTCGLLALALQRVGISARSWLAWQLGIQTDQVHQVGQILAIDTEAILKSLQRGQVAVVAGFQGVNADQRITTLGRGGSDTTAVALAHALHAQRCDIYTDVDGVFTADPQVVPEARQMREISYQSMLTLSYHGAKVLQPQSINLAMACNVAIEVRSSFSHTPGTKVVPCAQEGGLLSLVGVACEEDIALFTLRHLINPTESSAGILAAFAQEHLPIGLSVLKNAAHGDGQDLVLTVKRAHAEKSKLLLHQLGPCYPCAQVDHLEQAACIAVVGHNIEAQRHCLIETALKALERRQIVCHGLGWYPDKLILIVGQKVVHEAMRLLHKALGLDQPPEVLPEPKTRRAGITSAFS